MVTKREKQIIDACVAEYERHANKLTEDFLREMKKPDRSNVPDFYINPAEHRGNISLSSPTDSYYRRLSEEERQWRSPDADHWSAQWIRAELIKDSAKMREAENRMAKLFGARATTTEGTAGTDGAFSTGTGGTLIPRPVEAVIMIARNKVAKMRRFARIINMTRQQHTIPTAASMTAYMTAEGATATQGEPTLSSVPLVAMKAQCRAICTVEQLDDSAQVVVDVYTQRAGEALGELEDSEFFRLGTGTAPHVTMLSGTAYSETTSGTLDFASVRGMVRTLPQVYRAGAVWFVNSDVLALLEDVRDGNGRQFYLGLTDAPGVFSDDPTSEGTLIRRPVYEVDSTSGSIWFGDPSKAYVIGDRQGIRVQSTDARLFHEDKVEFKYTVRVAGNNTDTSAGLICTGITEANSL